MSKIILFENQTKPKVPLFSIYLNSFLVLSNTQSTNNFLNEQFSVILNSMLLSFHFNKTKKLFHNKNKIKKKSLKKFK